jgi:aspartate/methionine/tyrosine aminotransferase
MTTATLEAVRLAARIGRIEPSATMAAVAEAEKLRQQGIDVVDCTAGEPHFATPQHIKDAAIAAINANFSRYKAVGGTLELKDAILRRHDEDFGSGYKRDEVYASVGGKHALFNAISVLVDHGDEVILPVPYWVSFKDMVNYAGGTCEAVSRAVAGRRFVVENLRDDWMAAGIHTRACRGRCGGAKAPEPGNVESYFDRAESRCGRAHRPTAVCR